MQADGRLVEHVEHAGEARADLRGEADALRSRRRTACLAARESVRYSRPTSFRKTQALADFLQDARGDLGLLLREGLRNVC